MRHNALHKARAPCCPGIFWASLSSQDLDQCVADKSIPSLQLALRTAQINVQSDGSPIPQGVKVEVDPVLCSLQGILLPLCQSGTCTLREAVILSSVLK